MSAQPPYRIRSYESGDEGALLPLLRAALGERAVTPKSQRFWSWKHIENPFGRSYGIFAWEESSQRALALRILMRWCFTGPDGGRVDAVRAVDTATAAECRRMGFFTALTTRAVEDLAREGTSFIFNTPNASSLPGYLKMGWQVVAAWPMYARVVRPLRCLAILVPGRRSPAESLPPWEEFFRHGTLHWGDFRERYGDDVGRVVASWEGSRPRRGLRTERTVPFLDWRYGGHPGVTYAAIPAIADGKLAGFAVLRPNIRCGLKEAILAELFLQEADVSLARELLRAVRRSVRTDYLIGHFAEGSFELASLRWACFLKVPGVEKLFTVRRLGGGGADPNRADAWDLSAGDLEVF